MTKDERDLMYDMMNSLQYVEDFSPGMMGYGVRQELINKAHKMLNPDTPALFLKIQVIE